MKHSIRAAAASLIAAAVATTMGVANADEFYNDLENPITIDATHEVMNLNWDSVNSVGTSGSTTIAIFVQGHVQGDHPGCNIQGGAHFVTIEATSSNTAVAVVANGPLYTFDSCNDVRSVLIQATGLGSATITFAINADNTNNDPHLNFVLNTATFDVNVTEGSSPPVGCDADPAAPAWAAAILQASGYKPKAANFKNWVSKIAGEMTNQAMFAGYAKADHPSYENAVQARLEILTGNANLVEASAAARPGWACGPI